MTSGDITGLLACMTNYSFLVLHNLACHALLALSISLLASLVPIYIYIYIEAQGAVLVRMFKRQIKHGLELPTILMHIQS